MNKLLMNNISDKKIIDTIFLLMSFSLAFNNIPKTVQMNFVGGVLGNKLIFYPFIIGLIYTVYLYKNDKIKLPNLHKFLKFLFIYSLIVIVSLILGMINYPYYDLIVNGPIMKIEKLSMILSAFKQLGINLDEKIFIYIYMIAKLFKSVLSEILYAFCGAYMIYCWYYYDWQRGFKVLIKGIMIALFVMFFYNIIEISYLAGSSNAENLLKKITPYFHTIKTSFNWWPPILWKGQLRSYFSEPSNYGTYFAVVMPLLWYLVYYYQNILKKFNFGICIIFFTFCLFLTKARTAVALFTGEFIIFFLVIIILRNERYLKNFLLVILCSFLAFGLSNIFIFHYMQASKVINTKVINTLEPEKSTVTVKQHNNKKGVMEISKKNTIEEIKNIYNLDKKTNKVHVNKIQEYFENNLFSIASLNKRSNLARYSTIIADFKIGLDNPMLGIGSGLRNAYVIEYLPQMSKSNNEVKHWINLQKKEGILKSGFPNLCEYTYRFAETGILGLSVFLLPAVVLLKKLLRKIKNKNMEFNLKIIYIHFTIAFIGIMASAIGSTINATYFYWLLLGLGYAMCFGKENDVKDNGDTGSRQEY